MNDSLQHADSLHACGSVCVHDIAEVPNVRLALKVCSSGLVYFERRVCPVIHREKERAA